MESSDDQSYLQVHLWRSTSRKMTYPLFLCATFYMSGAVCQAMQIQMQNDLHLDPHTLSPFLKHAGHVDSLKDIEEEE